MRLFGGIPTRNKTMAEKTGISWTDSTFNPWIGCTKIGPGCDHCYAEALMDRRWHRVQWGSGQQRERTSAANWKQPLLWEREHEAFALMHGRRRRVFCASLADVFDNEAPPQWRGELWSLVKETPHLDWLILTKRIGNARANLTDTAR
jgi:protein gp37